MLLEYDNLGISRIEPTGDPATGIYRIVDLGTGSNIHGTTGVLDGEGRLMMRSSTGVYAGPLIPGGRSMGPFDPPFNAGAVAVLIDDASLEVDLPELGEPWAGEWTASVGIELLNGETNETYTCSSLLSGEATALGDLTLEGSCNLPFAGAADILVDAVYSSGGWSGEVTVTPRDDRIEERTFTIVFDKEEDDLFTGVAVGEETHGGEDYSSTVSIFSAYRGLQR